MQWWVVEFHAEKGIQLKAYLQCCSSLSILTTDAWSSHVMKDYMAISLHWVDSNWYLHSILLDFKHFPSLHTGDSTANMLMKVTVTTTDNASDVRKGLALERDTLDRDNCGKVALQRTYVHCIAHITRITVMECLTLVHKDIDSVRSVINALDLHWNDANFSKRAAKSWELMWVDYRMLTQKPCGYRPSWWSNKRTSCA